MIKSSKYDVICRSLPSSFQSKDGYHYSCYKTFTAVRKPQQFQNIRPRRESGEKLLRSDIGSPIAGSSGIFKQECIFCQKKTKSKGITGVERLGCSEAPDAEVRIWEAAYMLEDHEMITKIGDIDFVGWHI